MTKRVWDTSMETGVELIDTQHRELLDKLNELSDALEQNRGRVVVGDILDFLQFYAKWHFEKEEMCMEEYRCPAAQRNREAHAEFLDTFSRFYEMWQNAGPNPVLVSNVLRELQTWLVDHIQQTDTSLYSCVRHG